jgi:Fe-S-cluster containining protein
MKGLPLTECACHACKRACEAGSPGWFRPGEAEKAARLLRMPLKKFFRRYLGVNWWVARRDVFVLAPALVGAETGAEYPANPRGRCVFFKRGKCAIHAAKPYGCAHGNPHDTGSDPRHHERMLADNARTFTLWRKNQKQIVAVLGRKPQARELDMSEGIYGFFGGF